ncbi:type 1 glutamine amidotransferase [Undibacter mobilis]|uniref:Type 1 glutamine amidotransferase n=1 Tax=Undibacter mobilis TaxID=2292256 RepID=A0A371BB59_9BRAD|nr:type 1 glutamine amidotransferase [Undibacter mobilis]RDV04611.1 type 1 glutamine amidotransferase [Undibacter mobilis]
MPTPRLLVIEGNNPATMAEHVSFGGTEASRGYANLLRELLPVAEVDICYPADVTAGLPSGQSLEGYDGIAITGSGLHVYGGGDEVTRQIDLVREALKTGTPVFGSCWGLQIITTAAGGVVRKNPNGREIGFGRGIRLTEEGRKHPMYAGKMDVFNAPTVHLDEVVTLPDGAVLLASNAVSKVQAVEIRTPGSTAWGVQYHPEYPLKELAIIVRRIGTRLIGEGFFAGEADLSEFAHDLEALDLDPACKRLAWRHGISLNVLDKKRRVSEIANWLEYQVLPMRVKRGRG